MLSLSSQRKPAMVHCRGCFNQPSPSAYHTHTHTPGYLPQAQYLQHTENQVYVNIDTAHTHTHTHMPWVAPSGVGG